MRGCRGTLLVVAIATASLLLAGCGGDDGGGEKIAQEMADKMKALATDIDAATASQECDVAQSSTTTLSKMIAEDLPDATDPYIKDGLTKMVARIDEELEEECAPTGTSEPTTTTEEETTVAPPTTTPTTTTTTTTAPEEDEDEEEPETPEQPPGEGGGPNGPTPPGQTGGGPPDTGGVEEDE